jgi:hypothetical protein
MNRSLAIPAVGCLITFALVLAAVHKTADSAPSDSPGENAAGPEHAFVSIPLKSPKARPADQKVEDAAPMTDDEAREVLKKLTEKYMQPWREWEKSPHRLYSRAAPRPVPSISSDVTVLPPSEPTDSFLLATIEIKTGSHLQSTPCIIERRTKRVVLFANGRWIPGEKWATEGPSSYSSSSAGRASPS